MKTILSVCVMKCFACVNVSTIFFISLSKYYPQAISLQTLFVLCLTTDDCMINCAPADIIPPSACV